MIYEHKESENLSYLEIPILNNINDCVDSIGSSVDSYNINYIYLSCSLEERIKRDKKKLYIPALKGEKKHVVDVDIPFDIPKKSELSIDTEKREPNSIAEEIIQKLKLL